MRFQKLLVMHLQQREFQRVKNKLLLFIDKVVYNLGYKQPFSFIIKLNIYKTLYI